MISAYRSYCTIVLMLLFASVYPLAIKAESDTLAERLEYLSAHPDDKNALKDVAFHYMNIGNYSDAGIYADKLLKIGRLTGDRDFSELYGLIVLGSISIEKDADECFRQLMEARVIAEATDNQDALLSVNNSLGMYYLLVHNDFYTSTSFYYEALENARAIDDERRYGIILSNLSGDYLMMNDVSGLRLAEQSYEIAKRRGEPIPLYYAADALAHFCLMADSLDRVEHLIAELDELHTEGGFGGSPRNYLLKGGLAGKRGDTSEAYRCYALAMENFKYSDASEVSATYLAYARLLRRDNRFASAIKVLEYGLENSNNSEMKVHKPDIIKFIKKQRKIKLMKKKPIE